MKCKKLLYILLVSILTTVLVGCEDWIDVNRDPDRLSELSTPETLLPISQLEIANGVMGWHLGFMGGIFSQYWTQDHNSSQFRYLEQYLEEDCESFYYNIIPGALNDLKGIKDRSEEGSGNYLVAEVLSIYAWQVVTDLWGDVPYSEALMGEEGTFSPKFDDQQSIYTDLLARIDALLAMDFSAASLTPKFDFVYAGNIDNWLTFAKSLKLKLMIRLSETAMYDNSAALALANSGGFITETAMISGNIWESKDGKRHPMVEFADAGYFDNILASRTFMEYLMVNNDPRLSKYYEKNPDEIFVGVLQGDGMYRGDTDQDGTNDNDEEYSRVVFAENADIPLISTWEVNFYLAEVYARANDAAKAKAHYNAGIQASLDYWGVSGSITGAGEYAEFPNGTVEENIHAIAMQKWVSYCKLQHIEAFFERNRTKYPSVHPKIIQTNADRYEIFENFPVGKFTISVAGSARLSGNLPSSATYPNSVVTRNTTKPSQKTSMGEKVWWDQKAGK